MSQRIITLDDVTAVLFLPAPEFEMYPEKSALLVINFLDYADFFVKIAVDKGVPERDARESLSCFDQEAKKAADNAGKLLKTCRDKGFEIFHIRPEADGDRRIRLVVPSSNEAVATYEALTPRRGELVLSETRGDAFTDTRLDYVLRNMNIDTLIVCGLTTDQNVMLSTTKAVDLGYKVVLVEDACATFTEETQSTFIKWFRTFVSVKKTQEMLLLIR